MTSHTHSLTRRELTFPDDKEGRIYECRSPNCDLILPSVTTVLDRKDDPNKDHALKYWRLKNDGSDGKAHYEHLNKYKQCRGTIFHFNVLSQLDPTLSATHEEHGALRFIKHHSAEYPWVYSVLRDRAHYRDDMMLFEDTFPTQSEYDGRMEVTLRDAFGDDVQWATETFMDDAMKLGLTPLPLSETSYASTDDPDDDADVCGFANDYLRRENVINVEKYIPTDSGYSGQYDLLYEQPDGTVTLLDLKNSSATRESHEQQLCAYANAIHRPIDELCIYRAHSDSLEHEIRWESDFAKSRSSYMDEFEDLRSYVTDLVGQMDFSSDGNGVTA